MNPNHLINDVFWDEPQAVIDENHSFFSQQQNNNNNTVERVNKRGRKEGENIISELEKQRHQDHINKILEITNRHKAELNGEGTSRTPLIEPQEKPQIGKRFKRY